MKNKSSFFVVFMALMMGAMFVMNYSHAQTVSSGVCPVAPPAPGGVDYVYNGPTQWSTSTRTVTNTGVDTMRATVSPVITSRQSYYGWFYQYQSLTWQFDFTKISGTLGGTLTLYQSNEASETGYVAVATYTVTNTATQFYQRVVTGNPAARYMSVWTGTGTMAGTYYSTLLLR